MSERRATARRAGRFYFLLLISGLVAMTGFEGFLVPGDAATTARNLLERELVFRLGILTDIGSLVVFLFVAVALYELLEEVERWQARLMGTMVAVGVALGLANVLTKLAPLVLRSEAEIRSAFDRAQLDALVLGFLELNAAGAAVAAIFWGLWLFPFGLLVVRSGFFPRLLGFLLFVAGSAYLASSLATIVLPTYADLVSRVAMPLLLGELPIIFWLLIRGADDPTA